LALSLQFNVNFTTFERAVLVPPIFILSLINSEFYPLCTQNLDRIELYVSDEIADARHGIDVGIQFYIQLKVFDYDLEEVDEALMPRYTSQSLSYNPHPMFQM
jgi:hypothetical protein